MTACILYIHTYTSTSGVRRYQENDLEFSCVVPEARNYSTIVLSWYGGVESSTTKWIKGPRSRHHGQLHRCCQAFTSSKSSDIPIFTLTLQYNSQSWSSPVIRFQPLSWRRGVQETRSTLQMSLAQDPD